MKKISLGNSGKFALIDDEDIYEINKYKWYLNKGKITFYARSSNRIRMHRLIMKADKHQIVDHIDGDGLNNQKYNLRFVNHSQNAMNRRGHGTSKYLGVHIEKRKDRNQKTFRWVAAIRINGKPKRIGRFKSEENAAIAYNIYAEKYHGEFANYNNAEIRK